MKVASWSVLTRSLRSEMGSREETAHAKPSATVAAPPTSQEVPITPSVYPDWKSMAAYYGGAAAAGTPPAFFSPPSPSPYMWGGQHLMPPYGTPVPYHPMYPPGMYPHPAMTSGMAIAAPEMEGRPEGKDRNSAKKSKAGSGNTNQAAGKSLNGVKDNCTSANDDSSQSDGSGSEGSSNAGDQVPIDQDSSAAGKKSSEKMNSEGKIALVVPATNLNIGMDIWNGSHGGSLAMKERLSSVNIAPSIPAASTITGRETVPGNQWGPDERELKRQKRKESNRESARRSRQRKQQECEELSKRVEELTSENVKLRNEIDQVKRQCKALESENISIREEFGQISATELLSKLDGNNNNSSVNNPVDSDLHVRGNI